jgi:hypothetical protein
VNLRNQWQRTHHRSGWPFAMRILHPLHSDSGVVFDGFLEKKFAWGRDPGDRYNGFTPYRRPWVGVLHNPPGIPPWFNLNGHDPRDIFKTEGWKRSIVWCRGLYTLSDYLKCWLQQRVSVPVCSLMHPTETPAVTFSMERFHTNPDPKLVQIGWWLRRSSSFLSLRCRSLRKVLLDIGHDYMQAIVREESRLAELDGVTPSVDVMSYLPPDDYDRLLSENVVFLDLYDSSANNVVIECVVRSTPLLINPLPAVREYLGDDYPLYFRSLEEAQALADDAERLAAGHEYLKSLPTRDTLTSEAFLQSFVSSAIFAELEHPAPKISIIASVFAADDDIAGFLEDISRQSVFELCELQLCDLPASHRDAVAVEAIIRHYADRYSNIRYQKLSADPGLYEIWNSLIRESRGRYIAMAPLDDRRAPECLEHLLLALEMNPQVDVVCAGVHATRRPGERWERHSAYRTYGCGFNWQQNDTSSLGSDADFGIHDLFYRDESGAWIDSDCLPHCMPLWRKSLHERFGFFDEAAHGPLADWEFWVRCAAGGARFRLLRTVLGLYLENPNSHNRRVSTDGIKRRIIDRYSVSVGERMPPNEAPKTASRHAERPPARQRPDRFLIFTLARTGSTTLARALNRYGRVRCIIEPFNPDNSKRYLPRIFDRASLMASLDEIWKEHDGVKHVYHPTGWPFRHPDYNDWLVEAGHRVVLLRRANALQRVVSSQISHQCGVYDAESADARERFLTFRFSRLDTCWIRDQLASERRWLATLRRSIERREIPFVEVLYESIFARNATPLARVEYLNRILAFIGKPPVPGESVAELTAFLAPEHHKLNSHDVYRRIPGIEEIEREFGSDELGWLLR